ncbi:MAG: hypothetical protein R6W90_14945 [Ignavibacteriaceae bacterium]
MRYLYLILFTSLFISACSSTKEIETASLNQAPCKDETEITDPNIFTGETADNLQVYQQGDLVFATMDVRTYCNARITFDTEITGSQLKLKVNRAASINDNCVCNANVTTSFKNIAAGTYNVMVMNAAGNQILAEQSFTVK